MAYDINQLLTNWAYDLFTKKEMFIDNFNQVYPQGDNNIIIFYADNQQLEVQFQANITVSPKGFVHFLSRGIFNGNPEHSFQYVCLANRIGETRAFEVLEETVIVSENNKVKTLNPIARISQLVLTIAEEVLNQNYVEPVEVPKLSKGAFEELMDIQKTVMLKERDASGILALEKAFQGMDFPPEEGTPQ